MNLLKYGIVNIIGTLLRGFPFPYKPGLIKIGNPDGNSPVFLTCNYYLTVERVKNSLRGLDCYLLVANSKGINVWCAATGGHFTNHSVISALKTSGIEKVLNHRRVILPQLAAGGIEARVIKEKTQWNVVWGPVYAKDILDYVKNRFRKTPKMREVRFSLVQRIEMASMWAFPFSIIVSLVMIPFWRGVLLPLIFLIWSLSFLIFVSFPHYSNLLNSQKKGISFSEKTIIFDFGRVPLVLGGVFIVSLVIYSLLMDVFTWGFVLRWGFVSFVVILLISIDIMGSTPVYKSGLHKDRFLGVTLEEEKCKGCGICKEVCPRNCYEMDIDRHIAVIPRANRCVKCGACIVQCPLDALYFKGPEGEVMPPTAVRKFKLNLIGKRLVRTKEGKR